jgi:bacterioferritin
MAKSTRQDKKSKIIEVLNKARAMELQAIAQYMNQHYNLDDMDYGELAASMKLIAIDEMRHAEAFAERIKELGGEPTVEPAAKAQKGQEVEKIYPFDANLEDHTVDVYNEFLLVCRENGDSVSMKIFETIIDEEQSHYNYFANVAEHIKKMGNTYLARIAGTPSSTGLAPQGFVIREQGGGA